MVLDLNSIDINKFRNIHLLNDYIPEPSTASFELGLGVSGTAFFRYEYSLFRHHKLRSILYILLRLIKGKSIFSHVGSKNSKIASFQKLLLLIVHGTDSKCPHTKRDHSFSF